ncbi:hypothetical protein VCV18_000989 [Metarhizium anisopliae]
MSVEHGDFEAALWGVAQEVLGCKQTRRPSAYGKTSATDLMHSSLQLDLPTMQTDFGIFSRVA